MPLLLLLGTAGGAWAAWKARAFVDDVTGRSAPAGAEGAMSLSSVNLKTLALYTAAGVGVFLVARKVLS